MCFRKLFDLYIHCWLVGRYLLVHGEWEYEQEELVIESCIEEMLMNPPKSQKF